MSRVVDIHKAGTPTNLGIYIITCSTSKYEELKTGNKPEDTSGNLIEQVVSSNGHRVEGRELIPDSGPMIRRAVRNALASKRVDAILITGGTGVSPHDITIESVRPLFQKEISGFGELFRTISYEKIGSAAMLTRSSAGLTKGKAIFCLPGSPDAVQTALESLILPELGHLMKISREQ